MNKLMHQFLVLLFVCGCTDEAVTVAMLDSVDDNTAVVDTSSQDTETQTDENAVWMGCNKMDMLLVIDFSLGMEDEIDELSSSVPQFIVALDDFARENNPNLEYRIGITTPSMDVNYRTSTPPWPGTYPANKGGPIDDGKLIGVEDCGFEKPWIDSNDPEFLEKFTQLAGARDATGNYNEAPFAALERALGFRSEPGQHNHGFYRKGENSLLSVVIITSEDDCSVEEGGLLMIEDGSSCSPNSEGLYEVDRPINFLQELTGGNDQFTFISIAPENMEACDSSSFREGKRIKEATDMCGTNGVFHDICSQRLIDTIQKALEKALVACEDLRPV